MVFLWQTCISSRLPFRNNLLIKTQQGSSYRRAMVLILSSNSPNTGPVTSYVDFLEMETRAALRGAGMLYSFLPPLFKLCLRNTLESYSPAAWEIHVNSPAWLSGKTALHFVRKTAPRTHIIRLQLSYRAESGHASLCCSADGRVFVHLPSPPLWATPHQ